MNRFLIVLFILLARTLAAADAPLQICAANPHYYFFQGKPTVLIGSTEHYGAVLNLDFDYATYLDTLHNDGLNLTRTFSGTYREVPGSFSITDNTLAPLKGRYICPFARTEEPGNWDGGPKFDLTKYDQAYFDRLHAFLNAAASRGVIVEFTLFCTLYGDELWDANPFNTANNINGIGACGRREVYTLQHKEITAAQDAFVKKIVEELADVANVYYEICNEPYFENVTPEWQRHISKTIATAERTHKFHHLIAQNIGNGKKRVDTADPNVSIFNFHYATPPATVGENWALNKPIADDETGFAGKADAIYRTEGWDFILAGGAGFDHLDYSFTARHAAGDLETYQSPGGGSKTLRHQLGALRKFMDSFDLASLAPHDELIKGGQVRAGLVTGSPARSKSLTVRLMADPGKQYAAYVRGEGLVDLQIDFPAGKYEVTWTEPSTGRVKMFETIEHTGGVRGLPAPGYSEDLALRLVAK